MHQLPLKTKTKIKTKTKTQTQTQTHTLHMITYILNNTLELITKMIIGNSQMFKQRPEDIFEWIN